MQQAAHFMCVLSASCACSGRCDRADARRIRDACTHRAGGCRPARVPAVPGEAQAPVQIRGKHELNICAEGCALQQLDAVWMQSAMKFSLGFFA
jgi:hypothetical protein